MEVSKPRLTRESIPFRRVRQREREVGRRIGPPGCGHEARPPELALDPLPAELRADLGVQLFAGGELDLQAQLLELRDVLLDRAQRELVALRLRIPACDVL